MGVHTGAFTAFGGGSVPMAGSLQTAIAGSWLEAMPGGVGTLTWWRDSGGRTLLPSAVNDGTVRFWDHEAGASVGQPIHAHTADVWRLASWSGPDGRHRLASAGGEAIIRVWDPEAGSPVCGPIITSHGGGWVPAM